MLLSVISADNGRQNLRIYGLPADQSSTLAGCSATMRGAGRPSRGGVGAHQ